MIAAQVSKIRVAPLAWLAEPGFEVTLIGYRRERSTTGRPFGQSLDILPETLFVARYGYKTTHNDALGEGPPRLR